MSLLYPGLSKIIVDCFIEVHRELGPGLLEGPYHKALFLCLQNKGVAVRSQVPYKVMFRGEVVGEYLKRLNHGKINS